MKTFQQFELKIISSHVNRAMKSDLRDSMDFSDIMKSRERGLYLVFENHVLWVWSEAFGFARNCLCFAI